MGGRANWASVLTLHGERNNYDQIEITCQLRRFKSERDTEKERGTKLSLFKQKILNPG